MTQNAVGFQFSGDSTLSAVDRPRFAFTIYLVGGRGLGFACNLEAFYRTEGHVFLGQSYLRGVFEFQAKCNSYLLRHSLNVVHAEERATNRLLTV